ncbi:D-glycero-beta-D-manno-heptose 1,7-bisphosphate 7-phosphatase [bacterium]|nr:D-glycero-beta-D-manno-heptose 1,7-bisphosphate 7-phosphatase [bacterium]
MTVLPSIILDRDGVINYDSSSFIKSPDEWIPLPGSLSAISRLKSFGFQVSVATNQSGVSRGLYSLNTLSLIHEKMNDMLSDFGCSLDLIVFCPHLSTDNCNCRKPKPGMIHSVCKTLAIMPNQCIFVGDSIRDIQAAKAASSSPCLVLTGNGKYTLSLFKVQPSFPVFPDLSAFADHLIYNFRDYHV